MTISALQPVPSAPYLAAVERIEEMARLEEQARKRKSLLIFGPESVGKTRLLQRFVQTQSLTLYVGSLPTPRDLMLSLIEQLRALRLRGIALPANPKELSTTSLKGIVDKALDQQPFLIVLDHLSGPSSVVTRMIKSINYYGRTPVFFAARTPHMEDIGALLPICANRSERLEVKNFQPQIALEFAVREAERISLWASNLESALDFFVDHSEGNPGSILRMMKMAQLPQYRTGDQIKAHVLYLDYRMGRRS